MDKNPITAFPIAGLLPSDPRLATAASPLSSRQRKALEALLKSRHAPQQVIQRVEKALANHESIAQVIDQLKQEEARIIQARFATPVQREEYRLQQQKIRLAPRPGPLQVPKV